MLFRYDTQFSDEDCKCKREEQMSFTMTTVMLLTQSRVALLKTNGASMNWDSGLLAEGCKYWPSCLGHHSGQQFGSNQQIPTRGISEGFILGQIQFMSSLTTWTLVIQRKVASASLWMIQKATAEILERRSVLWRASTDCRNGMAET